MNEEMTEKDINEAEIQMIEDPELDARMNDMEKQNFKEFCDNYNQFKHIYDSSVIGLKIGFIKTKGEQNE